MQSRFSQAECVRSVFSVSRVYTKSCFLFTNTHKMGSTCAAVAPCIMSNDHFTSIYELGFWGEESLFISMFNFHVGLQTVRRGFPLLVFPPFSISSHACFAPLFVAWEHLLKQKGGKRELELCKLLVINLACRACVGLYGSVCVKILLSTAQAIPFKG